MYHPRTSVTIWYEDDYGRRWEYHTRWRDLKIDALEILEKYIDKDYKLFYTVHNKDEITQELDYYNFGYRGA